MMEQCEHKIVESDQFADDSEGCENPQPTNFSCGNMQCQKLGKLLCPICKKVNYPKAGFCSQLCFKSEWDNHKKVHDRMKLFNNFSYTGGLRVGKVRSVGRFVGKNIVKPPYVNGDNSLETRARNEPIRILNGEEIEKMRIVGKLARQVLDSGLKAAKVGMSTAALDKIIHKKSLSLNCYPSPLNYCGFPASVCTSVNEVICHGIPDSRLLKDGDLLNIDVTVYHDGFHGDLNETILIGDSYSDKTNCDEKIARYRRLVETTHECISKAIDIVKPGVKFRQIGNVIEPIAKNANFSVVRSYCGHGIHSLFHAPPNVPHYANNHQRGVMKAGMCFTIEPMINEGSHHDEMWPDDWTVVTSDGKMSAQFEQTLLVTETGCDILTARIENDGQPHFKDSTYYK